MKKYALLLFCAVLSSSAMADWTGKNAAGTTITFKNPGDCTSVVCVPETQIVDSAGASILLATSTLQTTINTSIGTTNTDLGPPGATACASDTASCSINALMQRVAQNLSTLNTTAGSAVAAGANLIGGVSPTPYPIGAVPLTASATGTTAATTATLAGAVGKTTYICGYSIRANATAAATVTNTITGVITATMSSIMWVAPLASGIGIDEQIFSPCIPASATNTGIAVVSGAPGSGGTVSSKGWGYQL